MSFTIDIDTGGTFTDGLIADHARETVHVVKVPSTPHDPTLALLDCVTEAARRLDLTVPALLRDTTVLRYANTIATNAVIERRGAKVGVLVGPDEPWPSWLVDEGWTEADMIERAPAAQALGAFQTLVDRGAQAVVVAMAEPGEEQAAKRAVRQEYPGQFLGATPVFTTSEVADGPDPAARLNAAFLAAYVHRHLAGYLQRAEERLRLQGLTRPLLVVHSSGGASRVARTHALNTYNSGPASGLLGARALARRHGVRHAMTLDMGGTSVDLGVVADGQAAIDETSHIAGLPVDLPAMRVYAVGGAGGSLVGVEDGTLRVGPDSAGARPGPACFGLGGQRPTVTDADLVLGHLDPEYFLDGRMRLDAERARSALRPVAEALGVPLDEAAWQVKEKVAEMSAGYARTVAAGHGLSGDDLAATVLVVYGGAGSAHAAGIVRATGLRTALMTPYSAVFSAYGSSGLDVVHAYSRRIDRNNPDPVRVAETLIARARRDIAGEGFDELTLTITATRARGEEVVSSPEELAGLDGVTRVAVRAVAPVPHVAFEPGELGDPDASAARRGERDAYWGPGHGRVATPAYERRLLRPGHRIAGPAFVDGADTTTAIPPGFTLTVDEHGTEILSLD
ncbi:hydantoinase/oxoprolinase family protein [Amycolatopsis rhizosphaerae]|uniref:Hydantoinase/oxoprolinase family protein n=1 Tax=Amycolatopsis rhizosphaerae TaxID=2053003 RepID=A0A558DD91_9PSEU|nr:hydantoinase/oxoprolinase family protein [Amycolatopsis rhizosphaerae]TVT58883.1 hydantoinase/oxoprolinase family protein [Amycolatopsis rhizosphaerae]